MRLIDADKVPQLSDMIGCAYEGGEYQAYKSGAEYGRGLVDDTPTIDPETLLAVLYINRTDRMDTVDGADNVIVLIFWPLLVVTRSGIACYRIIMRLLK